MILLSLAVGRLKLNLSRSFDVWTDVAARAPRVAATKQPRADLRTAAADEIGLPED